MTADLALSSEALTKRFGDFVAVDQLDLRVERGTIFGFLGANGAGKTTTIRMLCGLLAPTSGEALVDGVDVGRRPEEVKARIGYMAQKFALYNDLTVDENIRFFADVYLVPRKKMRDRRAFVLSTTGLEDRVKTLTGTLPAGIKQRLALAVALLHEPRVLFLDEPTAGVDPLSRRAFWRLIHQLKDQGTTVFVTTHHLDEAENCDQVLFMQAGRAVGLGPPRALRAGADRGDRVRITGGSGPALREDPRVLEIYAMGSRWHARLRHPAEAAALARDHGVEVLPVSPTLEEVFLEAIGEGAGR
ncbi:MAG: ABC transporter ATP-binding protein [Deltaproteobacteria bacterium]|nr:ABC transporter ATP-binding protein [Deltaproteobacteria bacterium]